MHPSRFVKLDSDYERVSKYRNTQQSVKIGKFAARKALWPMRDPQPDYTFSGKAPSPLACSFESMQGHRSIDQNVGLKTHKVPEQGDVEKIATQQLKGTRRSSCLVDIGRNQSRDSGLLYPLVKERLGKRMPEFD